MLGFTTVNLNILRLRRSLLGGQKGPPKGALGGPHVARCPLQGGSGGPREPLGGIHANREGAQKKIVEIASEIDFLGPYGGYPGPLESPKSTLPSLPSEIRRNISFDSCLHLQFFSRLHCRGLAWHSLKRMCCAWGGGDPTLAAHSLIRHLC